MLDRLEARVGPEIPFTNYFESAYRRLRRESLPTELYKEKIFLGREFGSKVILLLWCRFGASHKVVFLETARTTLRQMAATIESIFECNSWDLRLARVDAAVDVYGIPMEWVRGHVRVPHKRSLREFGTFTHTNPQNRSGTLYFGRGGDFFRIYDKLAEQMKKYLRIARKIDPDAYPSFEEFSGIAPTDLQVTRFERQMRIGRIPPSIATFGDLERNIVNCDPFSPIVIHPGGKLDLNNNGKYLARRCSEGNALRQTIVECGLAKTWALLSAQTGGNASRKIRQLSDFLPPDPVNFRPPNLLAMFQESICRQLSRSAVSEGTLERNSVRDNGSET